MPKIQKGYKQTEIGVIPEDWDVKRLGDICAIKTGKKDVNEGNTEGDYPFFTCSRQHTYSDSFSFDCEAILIAGNGEVGNLSYYKGKFEVYQRTYVLSQFSIPTEYLWGQLNAFFKKSLGIGTIGSSIPYIKMENIADYVFALPFRNTEQEAIAEVLSDTDALIERLGQLIEKKRWIKQGAMQRLLTGKQRLPGFTKKWERVALGLLLDYEQPTKYLVSSTEYDDGFDTPVLTVGKTFLLGRTNERHGIFTKLPCIIFDDFTTQSRYVDFPFKAKSSAMKMLLPKSETENLRFISEQMQRIEFTLQGHKRYWISEYAKLEISLPEPKEQEAIISILSDMDAEIGALERQRAKYRNIKQGMMQSLLTGRIRLPLS